MDDSSEADVQTKPDKRPYLEVNEANTYKSFLLKPFETKRLKTSDALEKVKQFLPSLKESTDKLIDDNKDDMQRINIENIDDKSDQIIEMNLAFVSDSEDTDDADDDDDEDQATSESDDDQTNIDTQQVNKINFLENYVNSEIANGACSSAAVHLTTETSKKNKKPIIHVIGNDDSGSRPDVTHTNK
jgi:hypothetical protein